jgi:hypothetical protein
MRIWTATGVAFDDGAKSPWKNPTQLQTVFRTVRDAAAAGIVRDDIVAKTGISVANVNYYLNKLSKAGVIAEKGSTKAAINAVRPGMNAHAACVAALAVLEDAFVRRLEESGVTDDDRKAFDLYKKLKDRVVYPTPGNEIEDRQAMKLAAIALIKRIL